MTREFVQGLNFFRAKRHTEQWALSKLSTKLRVPITAEVIMSLVTSRDGKYATRQLRSHRNNEYLRQSVASSFKISARTIRLITSLSIQFALNTNNNSKVPIFMPSSPNNVASGSIRNTSVHASSSSPPQPSKWDIDALISALNTAQLQGAHFLYSSKYVLLHVQLQLGGFSCEARPFNSFADIGRTGERENQGSDSSSLV